MEEEEWHSQITNSEEKETQTEANAKTETKTSSAKANFVTDSIRQSISRHDVPRAATIDKKHSTCRAQQHEHGLERVDEREGCLPNGTL